MDSSRLVVSHRLRNVPLYPPVRVLVYGRGYEATSLFEKTWKNLDGRVERETDVRLASEAEDGLGEAKIDSASYLENQGIRSPNELRVLKNECSIGVEADSSDLENVVYCPPLSVLIG